MKNLKIIITLILCLTTSCSNIDSDLSNKNVKKIITNFEKDNHFSGVISLKASDAKKYEYNFEKGLINLKGDSFEKESKFPIGELTTQYTAALLLKVLYQKYETVHESKEEVLKDLKLALHSPISLYLDNNKYWGNSKPNWLNQVTIHHLLTHTSGIVGDINENYELKKVCKDFTEQDNLLFEPGEKFHFSRTNYYLVALIIEKLTGKSFSEVIDEQLFVKYQLKSTLNPESGTVKSLKNKSNYRGVVDQFSYNPFNFKASYKLNNDFSEFDKLQGTSSIIANMEDLHSWNFALHKDKIILNADLYEIMTTKHINYKGIYYGYGLSFAEQGDNKIYFNVGVIDSYTSLMIHANDKSLVMLSNLSVDQNEILALTKELDGKFAPFIINPVIHKSSLMDELYSEYNNSGNLVNLINKFSKLLLREK